MALEQAGVQLIAQGADAFNADMKAATGATNTFVDATEKGGGRVSGAGQVMIGALRQVGVVAVEAFGQALRATAAFIGDSITLAGDFDQTMSVLQATSEATADDMALVSAKAKALGADLTLPATSAVDAGKAMLELSKAGFTVAESMDAAKGVLQLAAAAQITEARAAEINANAINAFNLEAKDSVFVSDLLAASANASSIEATDMADTYKMAAAVFSNFQGPVVGAKQSIIDLTTATGLLGNAGIKGSDAGTALKQSLLQLTAPSDKAKALMKALAEDIGVTGDIAYNAQGQMRSFPEILGLVSESTKSLSDEQRNYIISTIFGADATRAILVLMNEGPDAWAKMEDAVTRQGAAADLAAAQTTGYKGALEGAKSQVETLQLTIGQALTPVLADLLNNHISPGIAMLTDMASALSGDAAAFDKLSPAMQGVVTTIEDVITAGQDAIAIAQDLAHWWNTVGDESADLGSAVDDLSGIWEKAGDVVNDVLGGYQKIAQAVLPIITKFVDDHGAEISAFFKESYDKIITIVNLALDTYDKIVPPVLHAIAGFIEDHGSEIGKILGGAWDIITSIITGALDTITGIFTVTLALLSGDWEGAWTGIKGIADAQITAITGVVTGFLNIIAGFFDTSLAEIAQTWEDNWNAMVNLIDTIGWWEAGRSIILGIKKGVDDAWGSLVEWFGSKAGELYDYFMRKIKGGSPALEFLPVGASIVQGMMKGLSDMWPALTDLVSSLSDDLISQAKDIADSVQGALADSFGSTASIGRQAAKNLDAIKKMTEPTQAFLQLALNEAQQQAKAMLDPTEGAKFFQMRSKQIIEEAELQEQLNNAKTQADRDRITAQMALIHEAIVAEQSAFAATAGGNPMADIKAMIQSLMASGLPVNDTGVGADLARMLTQLISPIMPGAAYAVPPSTYSQQTNYNMPVYTNQSPEVLTRSMAIMQASMP